MAYLVTLVQNSLTHEYLCLNEHTKEIEFHNEKSTSSFTLQDNLKTREIKLFSSDQYLTVKEGSFHVANTSSGMEVITTPPGWSKGVMIYIQSTQSGGGGQKYYLRVNPQSSNKLELASQADINKIKQEDSESLREQVQFNLIPIEVKDLHK